MSVSSGTSAYRGLLRAIRIAFQGDQPTLLAARSAARDQFIEHRSDAPEQLKASIAHAQAVMRILKENVVQGRNVGDDKYKLNIHEHTERGDNDTVKKLDSRVKSFKDLK